MPPRGGRPCRPCGYRVSALLARPGLLNPALFPRCVATPPPAYIGIEKAYARGERARPALSSEGTANEQVSAMTDSIFEHGLMIERDDCAPWSETIAHAPPGILGTRPGAIAHPLQSCILSDSVIAHLASALPPYPISGWRQLYATQAHGFSLNSLYKRTDGSGASILAVLTMQGDVFGAYLADGIRRPQPFQAFYGEGESFLYSVGESSSSSDSQQGGGEAAGGAQVRIYAWTGNNFNFCFSARNGISIGGGDGEAGLCLDDTLTCGSTGPSQTFGNPVLCRPQCFRGDGGEPMDTDGLRSPSGMGSEGFEVAQVEVWGVDPAALKRAREQAAAAASKPLRW